MNPILQIVLWLLGTAALFYGLSRFLRYAGRRGWVYNKHNPRPRHVGTLGILEEIYQPSIRHVIEMRVEDKTEAEQDESGEPPEKDHP